LTYGQGVKPLIWSSWWALLAAAVPFIWLMTIELGTSRRVALDERELDVEVDTKTSRLFDVLVGVSAVVSILASLFLIDFTISARGFALFVGIALMFAAIGLSMWSRLHLGRFHRHALTSHFDHELVTTGPYQHLRHPLYSATIVAFLGIGLVIGNWLALAVLAALPTGALVRRVFVEEKILLNRLGVVYEDFCQTRARLLPYVW
jgi:protein-S-isoprenylcysteine O-methyltransferase Ste14